MTASDPIISGSRAIGLLSRLLLAPDTSEMQQSLQNELSALTREQFDETVRLANTNHVIIRGLETARRLMQAGDTEHIAWIDEALSGEQARIENAVAHLETVCATFRESGYDVTVIKSLDHWPDIGSDLDLYTNTEPEKVIAMMQSRLHAELAPRSWGDRLARKWNFLIPGLPEAIEIHMGRMGQTGEQQILASRIARHSRLVRIEGREFRVASIADRLMISVLQRMYRHFYFRLCDIIDSAHLCTENLVDFEVLRAAATECGIWEGTATYLVIVSDYVQRYHGTPLALPDFVRQAARFGGDPVYFARDFLRVPILPQSAGLYGTQLTGLLRKRELQSSARLGLLPWLATAAVVGQKITGSDKGIW
jgi:hypothetical protein